MSTAFAVSPAPAATALCDLRHIGHEFVQPNGKPLRVLDDINLTIRPEEIVALLGPSRSEERRVGKECRL